MPIALGYESYATFGMQTAFGTPVAPTITIAHLRTGEPIAPEQAQKPRESTARVMPGADQLWRTMATCDFNYDFEWIANPTAWLPILRAAWGHELKAGAGPVTHTYNVNNPPVDGGTDTGTDFYNHGLTIRHTLTGVRTYEIRDACVTQWYLSCEADNPIHMGISGKGQNFQDGASPVSFTDVTGTLFTWEHLYAASPNSGIFAGAANPPTTAIPLRSFKAQLDNNLRFVPFIGTASGLEMKLPTRDNYPAFTIECETDFDDISATDAVSIMTDFVTRTQENIQIKARVDANNIIDLKASAASNRPGVINAPRIRANSPGPVQFSFRYDVYPAVVGTDLTLTFTTLT